MYGQLNPMSSSPGTPSTRRPAAATNFLRPSPRPRCPRSPQASNPPTSTCPSTPGTARVMTNRKSIRRQVFQQNPAGFTAPTPAAADAGVPGSAPSSILKPNKEETKKLDAQLPTALPPTRRWRRPPRPPRHRPSRCPARLKLSSNNEYYKASTPKTPASSTTARSRVRYSVRLRSPSRSRTWTPNRGHQSRTPSQKHLSPRHQAPRVKIRGGEPLNR